jgi:cellulose biosynthesis protein BcsQ
LRASYKRLVDLWLKLPNDYGEPDLEANFMPALWSALEVGLNLRKEPNIADRSGCGNLKPDYLIYKDPNELPVLVVEDKKRVPVLANTPEAQFPDVCRQNEFYRSAVGYDTGKNSNGIRQYLDKDRVAPKFLAPYGLVFNGDFFQLWRRVDGLVLPLTPIQKVTQTSLPSLIRQLEYCLENPRTALISAIWNQKGGVSKTTNVINVGATLAIQGKKVLLIDLDPQNDLTRGVGADKNLFPHDLELCAAKIQLKEFDAAKSLLNQAIQHRTFPTTDKNIYNLSVLTTHQEAIEAFRDRIDVDPILTLKRLIGLLRSDYDYIFVDISPILDKLTQGVLMSCDTVLIPADLGGKSLHHAIHLYKSTIPKARDIRMKRFKEGLHAAPWNLGIVFSNCPGDVGKSLEDCIQQELKDKGFTGRQCETRLRSYAQAKVAEFKHLPVVSWRSSPITKLYNQLTDELFLKHNFVDH